MKSFLFFLFFTAVALAGIPSPDFEHYSIKNGLPDNKINCFRQDSYGILWMGTSTGITRFDGIHFTSFFRNEADSSGLINDFITDIFEVRKNLLLFTTSAGELISYDYTTGKFRNYSYRSELAGIYFVKGFRLSGGELWYSTGDGIIQLTEDFKIVKNYPMIFAGKPQSQSYTVADIIENADGNFWLSTYTQQLVFFNRKTEIFSQPFVPAFPLYQIHELIKSADGKYLYGATGGRGLLSVSLADGKAKEIFLSSGKGDSRNGLFCVMELTPGELLIGTGNGLVHYYTKTGATKVYTADEQNPKSLTDNTVRALYKTTDGTIWVATALGIHKTTFRKKSFTRFSQYPAVSVNRPEITHAQFVLNYNNTVSIFGHGEGLTFYNNKTGEHTGIKLVNSKGQRNESVPFCGFIENYTLWIGTWGNGLYKITLTPGLHLPSVIQQTQIVYNQRTGSLPNDFIKTITADKNGNLVLSTWGSGVCILPVTEKNKPNPSFKTIDIRNYRFSDAVNFVNFSFIDKYGYLWVGGGAQLFTGTIADGKFREVTVTADNKKIDFPVLFSYIQINENEYVCAGQRGIVKLKITGPDKETAELNQSLRIPVYQIAQSRSNEIWLLSANGKIYRTGKNSGRPGMFDAYSETGGFRESYGFGSADSNGNIYFSSMSGFITFHPDSLNLLTDVKQCVITSIRTGAVNTLASDPVITKTLETDYTNTGFSIRFSALDYATPERYLYSYRLLGSDNNWSLPTNEPEVNFSKLEPGEYMFQVKIFTPGDDNKAAYTSLAIIVAPPFYKTLLFRLSVTLLVVGFFVSLGYRTYSSIKAEQKKQQEFSQLLIETQEQERSRVAKDLHDSLGQNLLVIRNLLGLYKRKTGSTDEDLTSLDDIIVRSIDEVRSISSSLHPHQLTRAGLQSALKTMLSTVSASSNIQLTFTDNSAGFVFGPKAAITIYRLVQESVSNIIKHSGATVGSVIFSSLDSGFTVTIADNGRGMVTSEKQGSGLFNMKERAYYLSGTMSVHTGSSGTTILFTFSAEKLNA